MSSPGHFLPRACPLRCPSSSHSLPPAQPRRGVALGDCSRQTQPARKRVSSTFFQSAREPCLEKLFPEPSEDVTQALGEKTHPLDSLVLRPLPPPQLASFAEIRSRRLHIDAAPRVCFFFHFPLPHCTTPPLPSLAVSNPPHLPLSVDDALLRSFLFAHACVDRSPPRPCSLGAFRALAGRLPAAPRLRDGHLASRSNVACMVLSPATLARSAFCRSLLIHSRLHLASSPPSSPPTALFTRFLSAQCL